MIGTVRTLHRTRLMSASDSAFQLTFEAVVEQDAAANRALCVLGVFWYVSLVSSRMSKLTNINPALDTPDLLAEGMPQRA
jgi:hypothetical protein